MAKKYKKITYRNKKTGEVKYYYYEIKGKTTKGGNKVSAREFYAERGGKKRKTLTMSEAVDYLKSRSASFVDIQEIINDYAGDDLRGQKAKTYTKAGLDAKLDEIEYDKSSNFLRQLGYSFKEFEEEFGYDEKYIRKHGFEDIGNGVYRLKGTGFTFIWDYDTGLRAV